LASGVARPVDDMSTWTTGATSITACTWPRVAVADSGSIEYTYKKPQQVFFSRVRLDHPRCRSATDLHVVAYHDVVIYSKFQRNPFRGFGAPECQNLPFSLTLAIGFYNRLYYGTNRKWALACRCDIMACTVVQIGLQAVISHL